MYIFVFYIHIYIYFIHIIIIIRKSQTQESIAKIKESWKVENDGLK